MTSGVAERAAEGWPRRVVRVGGRLLEVAGLSAEDRYFSGIGDRFEPEFEQVCDDLVRYDYVCADLGANIGMKSLLLSQYVPQGRVLAVEAAPMLVPVLARNVAANGCSNVTVVHAAVGERDGVTGFAEESAYGHIAPGGVEVPLRSLSSLVEEFRLSRLDFVKIDVEGYEFQILRAALDLLNRHQSLVLVEFNSWALLGNANENPRAFAEWIFAEFAHVYRVRRDAGSRTVLERLPAGGGLDLLHTNLVHDGVVTDVLMTNYESRLGRVPSARAELALAARDAALAEAAAAQAGAAQARAECAALRRSTSWRVTAPLRGLGAVIRGR